MRALVSAGGSLSRNKKRAALMVAAAADLVQLGVIPLFAEGIFSPLEDVADVIVALVLLSIIGFRWRALFAFAVELVPGLALFPTWTAMVLTLPAADAEPTSPAPAASSNV